MRITRKHNPIIYNYSINSSLIEEVQATKYLGLTITEDLSWSKHVNNITSKALSVKAFPQRNLKSCPTQIELKCYNTMIRPTYSRICQSCLVPSHKEGYRKLERVQRQSARFITGNFHASAELLACLLI